jgi:hypothetical protein
MINYNPEFLKLLKTENIRGALNNKNFKYLYKNIQSDLIPQFTYFCYDVLNLDPLNYMDYVPQWFFSDLPITQFIIPDHIKNIEPNAFYNCSNMEKVEFANVVTIGEHSFDNCRALGFLDIPNSVNNIKEAAFLHCIGLEDVDIPDNITYLGPGVFEECTSLKIAKLGKGITKLEHSVFFGCTQLEMVEIPNTITQITSAAFAYCESLQNIKFNGTKQQWKDIKKDSSWNYNTKNIKVSCTDGKIVV